MPQEKLTEDDREIICNVNYFIIEPRYTLEDVIGVPQELKDELTQLSDFLGDLDTYEAYGAVIPHVISIQGPALSGKSHIAEALIGSISAATCYCLDDLTILDIMRGDPLDALYSIEEASRDMTRPVIIWVDQLDAIFEINQSGSTWWRIYTFLKNKDYWNSNLYVVLSGGCTDEESELPRAGTIDHQIDLALPEKNERHVILEYLKTQFEGPLLTPLFDKIIDWSRIADITDGFNFAALRELLTYCVNAYAHKAARQSSSVAPITSIFIEGVIKAYRQKRSDPVRKPIGFPKNKT